MNLNNNKKTVASSAAVLEVNREVETKNKIMGLLLAKSLISREQADEIKSSADYNSRNLDDLLADKKVIDNEELTKIKADIYNLPYQSLIEQKINDQALNTIPLEVSENYKIICFARDENKIQVGLYDPANFKAIEAIDFLAKEEDLKVEYFIISKLSFDNAYRQYKTLGKEISTALKSKAEEEAAFDATVKKAEAAVSAEDITKSAPVAKIVSVIIRHAVEGRASDIHIEPLHKESRVRYRIDGVLHTSLILPKNIHSAVVARIKVVANLKLDETRLPQDGRIRTIVNDKEIDLRISILPLINDEKVVMRILDVSRGAPTLEDLGFIGRNLEVIKQNMQKTDGMFLVTGPTGSGKSTTLFSVLNKLNEEGSNIVTLEDPVEYFVKGVNQSQIRPEIGFTFANGLRSLLRQDPDVIMVGEIRDNETAELAIHAGLTGHFVLSTLHTNDALGAIPRLLDMKVEPFLLGSTLNIVVAQRLSRKICPFCKTQTKLPKEILEDLKLSISKIPTDVIKKMMPDFDIKDIKIYKGKGCPRCGNTGYTGRVALVEALDVNDEIKAMIMEAKKILNLDDLVKNQNFITMKQDGIIKVLMGMTTIEEVLRTIHE